MPFHNRYVVAAFDASGEQIAVLSPSFEWIEPIEAAVCFPSQQDAKQFIETHEVGNSEVTNSGALNRLDHVRAVFVTVEQNNAVESEHVPGGVISFTGIYG